MSYAIVQASLEPPDIEAMRRAFALTPTLTAVDADILGRDAFGILVKGKTLEAATGIHAALKAQGVETFVVSESDLPELPPTKFVNRLDFSDDALMIYDPLGRSFPLEWKHLMLIAAGHVRLTEFNRVRTEKRVKRYTADGGMYYVTEVDYDTREQQNAQWMLELVLTRGVARYSIKADGRALMLFNCLGDRRTRDTARNFALLVQALCHRAPHAGLNRGAYHIREGSAEPFPYPTRNAFQEEITWLIWQMRQRAGTARH